MLFFFIIIGVVVLDQLTKWWVLHNFSLHESREIISGFFHLTYIRNTGAAFGILAGEPSWQRQLFFIGVATVALIAVYIFYRKFSAVSKWYSVSLALIAGGAIGNLIDRLRFGYVVDFFEFFIDKYHWPAFNIADSAICVGIAIFLFLSLRDEYQPADEK